MSMRRPDREESADLDPTVVHLGLDAFSGAPFRGHGTELGPRTLVEQHDVGIAQKCAVLAHRGELE